MSRGRGGVLLSWSAPTGRINGYKLLRQRTHLDETSFSALSTDYNDSDGPAATTYIDRDATGDGAYVYKVESINADGNKLGTTSTLTLVHRPAKFTVAGRCQRGDGQPDRIQHCDRDAYDDSDSHRNGDTELNAKFHGDSGGGFGLRAEESASVQGGITGFP